jgi:hypothetical protein
MATILTFPCEVPMNRVTGIGGIFFKAQDPKAMQAWYKRHLGIDVQDWGGAAFRWTDADGAPVGGTTAWSIMPAGDDTFAPSTAAFMVNYRVANLEALRHRSGGEQGRAVTAARGGVESHASLA